MSSETDKTTEEITISNIFEKRSFNIFILITTIILAYIHIVLKDKYLIGAWHIIFWTVALAPLVYIIKTKEIKNQYTKWLIPSVAILIVDIFYYNNEFTQTILPFVVIAFISILYMTSMHSVSSFYQTLLPKMVIPLHFLSHLNIFFSIFLSGEKDIKVYKRFIKALLITIPFMGLFLGLFMSADRNFDRFITQLLRDSTIFELNYIFWLPLTILSLLLFFIYTLSNSTTRVIPKQTKTFDTLVVGTFLSMTNILFGLFVIFQIGYLFGGVDYIKSSNISVAYFARSGFFQLMWVMGIVLSIYLFIMSRFRGEKSIAYLLSTLVGFTMIIGFASLKKMYLYQSIKGATVLRYYVEWFDYFLLIVLGLGIIFIIKQKPFARLLDMLTIIGIIAFTLISSLNIDGMVASHNIAKFKESRLDKDALSRLSVDILPYIKDKNITITRYNRRDCDTIRGYHFGYCYRLGVYGYYK